MTTHHWKTADTAAQKAFNEVAIRQMVEHLNDNWIDLDDTEAVIRALHAERFPPGLIDRLMDDAVKIARTVRNWGASNG